MHPAYFETRFRIDHALDSWPVNFAIITAYTTTGECWTESENSLADAELEQVLRGRGVEPSRIAGYSPSTGHEERGWACSLSVHDAFEIGMQFRQDAIYVVVNSMLYVTYCDQRRKLVPVAPFVDRLDP
ncbi:DUF3293 domain-containing protein [Gemmatimonas sp.]|uniref:DUF3293 domain-containing protein n=2 Tax=Gemmatimonas sp. TaxID=1962908 RepID=UPI0035696D3E